MNLKLLVYKNSRVAVLQIISRCATKTSIHVFAKLKPFHLLDFWILNIEVSILISSSISYNLLAPHDIGPGSYIHEKGDINFGFEKFKKPAASPTNNTWGK